MTANSGRSALPFLVLGDSRRQQISQRLTTAMTAWRRRWSVADEALRIAFVAEDPCMRWRAEGICMRARAGDQEDLLHVLIPPDLSAALLGTGGNSSTAVGTPRSAAAGVQSEVARSLCESLLRSAGITDAVVSEGSAADMPRGRRYRWLSISVALGNRIEIALSLSMRVVELFLTRTTAPRAAPLARRRECIAHASLKVEALLGEAEVTLRDLAALAPGDVIVLDQSLAQAGHLLSEEGQRIASVVFGSSGPLRAFSAARHEQLKR